MATVIRLVALALGIPTSFDGKYVKSFNPAGLGGRGELVVTDDPKEAVSFPTAMEAINYYRQDYGTRADGLPNRPLTAYSAEFINLDRIGETRFPAQ